MAPIFQNRFCKFHSAPVESKTNVSSLSFADHNADQYAHVSGGGGMELLLSLRIQLTHLGAQVVGRQLMSNGSKPAKDESIEDLLQRLLQMNRLNI